MDSQWATIVSSAKSKFEAKWRRPIPSPYKMADFDIVRVLGSGQFGTVLSVKMKKDKKDYALKVLDKEKIVNMSETQHCIDEKRILSCISWPLCVSYKGHFKDNANLYLLMEVETGGELFGVLQDRGKFTEEETKFYASQVTLALEYLQACGIVFRDLKPENLMITATGFLKLTDFGFAKRIGNQTTSTLCGTPEYLAPEVVTSSSSGVGYSFGCDMWALGILIYEMANGKPPFISDANNQFEIFQRIVVARVRYPREFSASLKKMLGGALQPVPSKRLDIAQIKQEPWFQGISWMDVLKQKIQPPYVPPPKHDKDKQDDDEPQAEFKLSTSQVMMYEDAFKDF